MDQLKKLYIEPTSRCNLKCEMCFRHTWFDEDLSDMSLKMFEKIMKTIPEETETIFFGGMGEPLCHPDIIDMIKRCGDKNYNVEVLTNGSLLTEEMSRALLEGGMSRLWISMDDIEPVDHNVMGHQNYDEIIGKIIAFNKIRRKDYKRVKLGITFVATKSNVHQLAGLPRFIRLFDISDVNVSNLYPSDFEAQKEILYDRTLNMSVGSDTYRKLQTVINIPFMDFNQPEVQKSFLGLLSKMNFNLEISGNSISRKSKYCPFINEGNCFVRSDGNISPCMELLHNGRTVLDDTERKVYHHTFGNIRSSGLKDIWESEDYSKFRQQVREFDFSPCIVCGHCEYVEENIEDCMGSDEPACGACLWAEGLLSCP